MVRQTKRTPKRETALIDALRSGSAIGTACAMAGIGRSTLHEWRHAEPDFNARFEDAIEYGTDVLEDVARTRAVRESDTLLIFLLKARRPDKYRERLDINLVSELRSLAEKAAAQRQLDPAAVVAEAERLLSEAR